MNAPDSNHETPVDGLNVHGAPSDSVQPTPIAPNQRLLLVPHGNPSSGSANVTEVQVSGTDALGVLGGGFYSSSIDGQIVGMIGSAVCSNPKPSKKRSSKRYIWAGEPHQCFLDAYNRLPEDKRVPKKITEDMRKAGCAVTRENVASHLQKHRLNLRGRENRRRNPGRPSSTPVPPREEINLPNFPNGNSNSTHPPNEESHFISTNPNFQSHSFSINPNSQLPIQTPPIPTNPNSYLPQQSPSFPNIGLNSQSNSHLLFQSPPPFHSPSFSNSTRSFTNSPSSQSQNSFSTIPNSDQLPLNEPMVNQMFSPFEQIHLCDPNAGYVVGRYNDLSIRGGTDNSNFSFGGTGQSSNAANNSNVYLMANHFPPDPIATNFQLVSNIDGFGNVIHPTLPYPRFGDESNHYPLGAHPNFYDYNMNMNLDHTVQVDAPNNMDMNFKFNFPLNSNVANDFQVNDIKQSLQANLGLPGDNGGENKPSLPQSLGNHPGR